jgi:hypothetical protein
MRLENPRLIRATWEDSLFLLEGIRRTSRVPGVWPRFPRSSPSLLNYIHVAFPESIWYIIWGNAKRVGKYRAGFIEFSQTAQERVYQVLLWRSPSTPKIVFLQLWEQILDKAMALNAHRIEFEVPAYLESFRRVLDKHSDAKLEGVQESAIYYEGKWYDLYLYGRVLEASE